MNARHQPPGEPAVGPAGAAAAAQNGRDVEPPAGGRPPTGSGAAASEAAEGGGAPRPWDVRRIVVALDASPASAAAARAAARLASRLSAELRGLFVEDAAVLRLEEHGACIEIGTFSATRRTLPRGEMARRLRAQAARARRMLEQSALAAALENYRFDVVRGEVRQTVAELLGDADLLSLGRAGTTGLARLGGVARAALADRRGQLLLLPAGGRIEAPVVAVFGDRPGARRALAAALRLLDHQAPAGQRPRPGSLTVLVVGTDAEASHRLESEARAMIAATGHPPSLLRFRRASPGHHHALAHAVADVRAHLLLLPAESPLVRPEDLETVVAGLDCAVLLVR